MRWQNGRESENVEDRRGEGVGGGGFGGRRMGIPIPIGRGGLGLGGLVALLLISWVLGLDPLALLGGGDPTYDNRPTTTTMQRAPHSSADDELKSFVSVVLADTEDTWHGQFQQLGRTYQEPSLVLFSGGVDSACGMAQSAMGPFYCPLDRKVYIDLSFYRDLRDRFRAPGDFAQAYVIAHEVGHHVQTLLGIADQVQAAKQRVSERQANALQVRMELQADCLAGMWAKLTDQQNNRLEQGDIEEGLNAASRIGDDTLQKQMTGRVVPDAFTHGSSEQRVRWFTRGFQSGSMQSCDTFSASQL